MSWYKIIAGLSLVAVASLSCGGGRVDSERSPGELVFRANCQSCHRLPKPKDKSDEQWPALVARYGAKAKLNNEQIALITGYLVRANDTK